MIEARLVVTHKVGLHARPAALFVQTANKFSSRIRVSNLTAAGQAVDAKSIIGVLTLGVQQNHKILVQAEGADEQEAVRSLTELVRSNFGEAA